MEAINQNITPSSQYQMIHAKDLQLNAKYQRPLDGPRVKGYADHFDPSRLEIIDVAHRRDGQYWVIDGQHRVMAARIAEWGDPLLCLVHRELTIEQEAERYVRLNKDRKSPSKLDLFWARLAANDEHATNIKSIVESEGYWIPRSKGSTGIRAIAAVERAYKSDGGPILRQTLRACRLAWGSSEQLSATVLNAVSSFISQYRDEYDHDRLVDVLVGVTTRRLEAGVSAVIAEMKDAGGTYEGATTGGIYIQRIYNKGLRSKKMPAWQPGKYSAFIRKPVIS